MTGSHIDIVPNLSVHQNNQPALLIELTSGLLHFACLPLRASIEDDATDLKHRQPNVRPNEKLLGSCFVSMSDSVFHIQKVTLT